MLKRAILIAVVGAIACITCVPAAEAAIVGAAGTLAVTFDDTPAGGPGSFFTTGPVAVPPGPNPIGLGPIVNFTGDAGGGAVGFTFTPFSFFVGADGFVSSAVAPGAPAATIIDFDVDYFLDAGGLPPGPIFAVFDLTYFVPAIPGSFVDFDAVGVFSNSVLGVMDVLSVGFTALAGPVPVAGTATVADFGFIPAQLGFSTMNLTGTISLVADPADLSFVAVPEPSSWALMSLGAVGMLIGGYRARKNKAKKSAA